MLVIEDVRLSNKGQTAVVYVFYRFDLVRTGDALPIVEHSREVYSLGRVNDSWLITANIDHFTEEGQVPIA